MNKSSIAPRYIPVTVGALAAALLLLPQLQPVQAAKKPKPFIVKGTYTGTYLSQDTTISGPIKLVVSSYKKLPAPNTFLVKGKLSIGTKLKNQKCQGVYNGDARYISVNAPTARGYAGTFAGTLGGDEKTFTGTFAYTHVPELDEQVLGTATVAKR
jgi:hypothetical protein